MMSVKQIFALLMMGVIGSGLIETLAGRAWAAAPLSLLDTGSHCVAYKAKKRMFFLATVQVVGKSCDVAAQVIPEIGSKYRIEITLPIHSLKSGEAKRDSDVAVLLGADQDPELRFVSDALTVEEWQALFSHEQGTMNGELKVNSQSTPLNASLALTKGESGIEVDGVIKTSFKQLHLKPPQVALGVVAKVRDELELHFHLLSRRTLGAESILGEMK
jgi:hypothetical protein